MNQNDREIWEILSSVLNGNPSSEELRLFNLWLSEKDENRKFYETIRNSKKLPHELTPEAKERIYARVQTAIEPDRSVRRINLWAYSAVASIAILLTLSILYFFQGFNSENNTLIEAKTPHGVKSKITLPDGSIVYLNSGSILKYPGAFSKGERKVILNGEAYFEVQKETERTFIVETGNIQVKVLGTHFNVKNFSEEHQIETSLLEGSVEISMLDSDSKILLTPNQQAIYDKHSKKITKQNVDAELTAMWKDGKYYFSREKFSTIATKLERYFNVKIVIGSEKLNETKFSGIFDKNRTIFQILDVMKSYSNFNYKVQNDSIYITDSKK